MDRRRFLQLAFTTIFVLFLLALVFKFRPRVETPPPAKPQSVKKSAEGTLSAQGFRYTQTTKGKEDFVVTAKEVTESTGGLKLLTDAVVTFPGQGKAWGNRGSFSAEEKVFRVWDDAHLSNASGWTAASTGFRLTPEGEIVSEGPVALANKDITGGAQLLRYERTQQKAHLEGDVTFHRRDQSFTCRILDVNLQDHTGQILGPVTASGEQGTIAAPDGTLVMDDQNRLQALVLGSPATGEGPKARFTAKRLVAHADEHGGLSAVDLEGDAVVQDPRPPVATVKTDVLHLVPQKGSAWDWTAPGPLVMERDTGHATATSGTGTFGGEAPPTADLAGRVKGADARGTFEGDKARLAGGDWTLAGHARADKPGEHIQGDTLVWKQDGSTRAEGNVSGTRQAKDQPELAFTSRRAQAAPNGYPARLEGDVKATRGTGVILAPVVILEDDRTAEAREGATGTFQDSKGQRYTVTGKTLRYDGAAHAAVATDDARGEGQGYWITARVLTAHLDEQNQLKDYLAEGDARFDGTAYSGTGDRLTYDPATESGRAFGDSADAVVIEKKPYRRLAGPVVDFAPRRAEELPGDLASRRGHLEGVQETKVKPKPKGPAAPKGKKEAHGTGAP